MLYGLKQDPRTFFENSGMDFLNDGSFNPKKDRLLLMKSNTIFIVYTYDTILSGPNSKSIEEEIQGIMIQQDEQRHSFEIRYEVEVDNCFGMHI